MLLKQCYVRSFGKLQDFTYDFTEGLNVICAENGWGKSTLAAFLRAMFYGMSQAGSRTKLEEAERRKYKPWNGGVMGGYLIFESNKKEYKVERTFGKKEAEDTFRLIDLSTNLDSTDFSAELGKELFGLDKEAYSRSTYLPQNKIFEAGMNDSIGKKLGKIAEGDEESGNFDKAYEKLEELRKKYIPDRQKDEKGYVAELTHRISEVEERLAACRRKEENAKPWREKEREASAEKKKLEAELLVCREKLEAAAGYEALAAKKQHHAELCSREETLRLKKESMQGLFSAGMPEPGELRQCRQDAEAAAALLGELRSYRLESAESQRLLILQQMFSAGVPEPEELQQYLRLEQEAKEQSAANDLLLKQAEERECTAGKARKQCQLFGALCVFLCVCAGIGAAALASPILWCVCAVGAAGGVGFLFAGAQKRREEKVAAAQKADLQAATQEALLQGKQGRDLLTRFGVGDGADVTEGLYRLTEYVREYRSLSGKKEQYDWCVAERETLLSRSEALLLRYGMETEDVAGSLHILENRTRDFIRIAEELEEACKKREQFEQENPPDTYVRLVSPEVSFAELQVKEQELLVRIARAAEEEKDCRGRAEAFEEEAEGCTELEETLEELCARLEAKKREHFYITETIKCLRTAKEQFSSRYMRGLTEGFGRYVSLLGAEDFSKSMDGYFGGITTDVELNMRVSAYGEEKELGYFSTGFRDLIGLCMRFALVDALFLEEQPFLVLDDPFVNLDAEKIERASVFLKEASKRYQILYLVCHNSRA